jgi:hypothetical protein
MSSDGNGIRQNHCEVFVKVAVSLTIFVRYWTFWCIVELKEQAVCTQKLGCECAWSICIVDEIESLYGRYGCG